MQTVLVVDTNRRPLDPGSKVSGSAIDFVNICNTQAVINIHKNHNNQGSDASSRDSSRRFPRRQFYENAPF